MAKFESLADYEEEKVKREKKKIHISQNTMVILLISFSIILGVVVYGVSSYFLQKDALEKTPEFLGEQLALDDETVSILYGYVTDFLDGERAEKFLKLETVTMDSFTDEEKFRIALHFAKPTDFEFSGELNSDRLKVYVLDDTILKQYMSLYFGPNVDYQKKIQFDYPFSFQINGMNVGHLSYDEEKDGYDTVFSKFWEIDSGKAEEEVLPYYTELSSAIRKKDGSIVLQERFLFTDIQVRDGVYEVLLYRDYEKSVLLDTISDLSLEDLEHFQISFEDYKDSAIVEYHFALNGNICYFESSRILY